MSVAAVVSDQAKAPSAAPQQGLPEGSSGSHTADYTADLHTFSRRELCVLKSYHEPFGMRLLRACGGLYVGKVWKFTMDGRMSPAYRAGLKFGDRLSVFNGLPLDGRTSADRAEQLADGAGDCTLEVDETPLYHHTTLAACCLARTGLHLHQGIVAWVDPNSPAGRAGLEYGEVLVQVGEHSTLGMDQAQLETLLDRALRQAHAVGGQVYVAAVRKFQAQQLADGCRALLQDMGRTHTAVHEFVDQTLALDHGHTYGPLPTSHVPQVHVTRHSTPHHQRVTGRRSLSLGQWASS